MKRYIAFVLFLILLSCAVTSPASAASQQKRLERPEKLIPMGQTAGVRFTSKGLMVVGYADIPGQKGSPAQQSGLQIGDFITHADGIAISGAEAFQKSLQNKDKKEVSLKLIRRGSSVETTVAVQYCEQDKQYKIGAWVRDSISGIGTLTFYDPQSGMFGALGHGINDTNTKLLLPISSGSLLSTQVVDIKRGQAGQPGELKGSFEQQNIPGSLMLNATSGLYGVLDKPEQFTLKQPMPAASQNEVRLGKATMLSNITGQAVESFDIELVRIFDEAQRQNSRNFLIRITDQKLIDKTGGIVQGMSGSPILQNGKIIGALTHVLVSDPKRGYGIFIDNMLSEIYSDTPAISLNPAVAA